MNGNNKAATRLLTGRGPKSNTTQEQFSRIDGSLAMTHAGRADLMERAARIIAQSLFSSRLTNPDVHTLEEGLRVLFEDAAMFHRARASRLRDGGNPLAFLFDAEAV